MRLTSVGKASKPRPDDQQAEVNLSVFQLSALVLLLITLSVFFSLLFARYAQLTVPEYSPGDIAMADVVVPFDLLVLDEAASEARRKVARENVLYPLARTSSVVSTPLYPIFSIFPGIVRPGITSPKPGGFSTRNVVMFL